jgi:hypothetical protein
VSPKVSLPADADPGNASTFAQGYKVLADFVAWLMNPKAKSTEYDEPISVWRNARGHDGFIVDHMGFPMGRSVELAENWAYQEVDITTSGADNIGASNEWTTYCSESDVKVAVVDPDIYSYTRAVNLDPMISDNAFAVIYSRALSVFHQGVTWVAEFDIIPRGGEDVAVLAGVGAANVYDPADIVSGAANVQGAWLVAPAGAGVNYEFLVRTSGGAGGITLVDTGIPKDAYPHHVRIAWMGASMSDSSSSRIQMCLDDGVYTHGFTSGLPTSSTKACLYFAARRTGDDDSSGISIPAPVKFRASQWAFTR